MYFMLFFLLLSAGCFFTLIDMIPLPFYYPLFTFVMEMVGIILVMLGVMVLVFRIYQTGVHLFIAPPTTKNVILIHQRRGGNAKFIRGKLIDLEHIAAKNKLFKDTGEGIRIAGHDVRRTHETISFTIPDWLVDYFRKIRERYGVRNIKELKSLYEKLKNVTASNPFEREKQLKAIPELRDVMEDPVKREVLLNMKLDDLRNLRELLFDGQVIEFNQIEEYIENAAPTDLETLTSEEFAHKVLRFNMYKLGGKVDWAKWAPVLVMLMIGGAMAVLILKGALGT